MNIIDFKNMPLRRKITVTAVLASTLSLTAAFGILIAHERRTAPGQLVNSLSNMAKVIAGNSTGALSFNDLKTGLDLVQSLQSDPHIQAACLYDAKGQVFAKYEAKGSEGQAPSTAQPEGVRVTGDKASLFQDVRMGNDRLGTVYLQSDMREMDERLQGYLQTILGVMVLSCLLSFLVAQWLQKQISDPLQEIITNLSGSAEQMAASATQISTTSQQMSEGANESASSLEETSASLEEIASMTRQNAGNADRAAQFMKSARERIIQGNQSVESTVKSMVEMKESAEKVSKIIKTIEEIAFQTNLLALNAAVEAARAGEHGRGFAVVAEEVRNLAQRSAAAAKDSAALIEANAQRVTSGVKVSGEAGAALSEIVTQSGKISDLVLEIASASQEQSKGIGEVNGAVSQMDKLTQRNSSNAEELSSSSEELSGQAQGIRDMVEGLVRILEGGLHGPIQKTKKTVSLAVVSSQPVPASEKALVAGKSGNGHELLKRPGKIIAAVAQRTPEQVIPLGPEGLRDF